MAKACCSKHHHNLNATRDRSIVLIAAGLMLLWPAFEHLITAAPVGGIFFALASGFLGHSIYKDFKNKGMYYLGTMFLSLIFFIGPLLVPVAMANAVAVSAMVMLIVMLFSNLDQYFMRAHSHGGHHHHAHAGHRKPFIAFPEVEKIILLFVNLSWCMSLGSLLFPANMAFAYTLHDAFLLLGITNLSSVIKSRMQTKALIHNHSGWVTVMGGNSKKVAISQLKRGMKIRIDHPLMLPVRCEVQSPVRFLDTCGESERTATQGEIEKNTHYISGNVTVLEDYRSADHAAHHQNTQDSDSRLSLMLLISLCSAVVFGAWQGWVVGSAIAGMQTFCLNLLVSCPCVFLVTKPIITTKLLKWLDKHTKFEFIKMPVRAQVDIVVFDRTHTLYHPNPNNRNEAYALNPKAKDLIKKLNKKNITCYILSGHGTNDWQAHLNKCRSEFQGLIDPDKILFDKKYHGSNNARKQEVIRNLQLYGSVNEPSSLLWRLFYRVTALMHGHTVAMIGDGSNDVLAMEQADVSVCVGKGAAFNDDVLKQANFCVDQENLSGLSEVIHTVSRASWYYELLANVAFFGNLSILAGINGLAMPFVGVVLSPSLASLILSVLCVALIGASSMVKVRPVLPQGPSCACRSCEMNHDCKRKFADEIVSAPLNLHQAPSPG